MTFEEFSLIIGQTIWRLNDRIVELVIRLLVKIIYLIAWLHLSLARLYQFLNNRDE